VNPSRRSIIGVPNPVVIQKLPGPAFFFGSYEPGQSHLEAQSVGDPPDAGDHMALLIGWFALQPLTFQPFRVALPTYASAFRRQPFYPVAGFHPAILAGITLIKPVHIGLLRFKDPSGSVMF
jgi:hypothetical protein